MTKVSGVRFRVSGFGLRVAWLHGSNRPRTRTRRRSRSVICLCKFVEFLSILRRRRVRGRGRLEKIQARAIDRRFFRDLKY
jgi:hypothetical protein